MTNLICLPARSLPSMNNLTNDWFDIYRTLIEFFKSQNISSLKAWGSIVATCSSHLYFALSQGNIEKKPNMPILESLHSNLRIIGMTTNRSIQTYPLNARNLTMLLIFGINITCNIGFLIYETNNLMEFTDSLYLTFTAIMALLILIDLIWKMRELFVFVNRVDETVDQS